MSRFAVVFLLAGCFLPLSAVAQNISIKEEPMIQQMMNYFVESNKAVQFVEGWRIEILATTDRQKLENTMRSFQFRYPDIPVDWLQARPHFKLRAGAFATKMEANRVLQVLKRDYPGAYWVLDNRIRPAELVEVY